MRVVFRADASLQIGTGHVMRCLTLADALAAKGVECQFICREHPGNLIEHIRSKGHVAHALPANPEPVVASIFANKTASAETVPAHSHWLGATQEQDATECALILSDLRPDWLIVDHYGLDSRWEKTLQPFCHRLMVIDDLADRSHQCDLLLDQTYGRKAEDYKPLVPADCILLCGSQYALLRPDFAALRAYSLQRRETPKLEHLLITMGGVDKDNATGSILDGLQSCPLPKGCQITVVMGTSAPWLAEVQRLASGMPWNTQVSVGVSNMAQLMANSDLAIGAAGATSWERCCLGLPTGMLVLADNQKYAAWLLSQTQAVRVLHLDTDLSNQLASFISDVTYNGKYLKHLGQSASVITDGLGCQRIADWLTSGGATQ